MLFASKLLGQLPGRARGGLQRVVVVLVDIEIEEVNIRPPGAERDGGDVGVGDADGVEGVGGEACANKYD